LRVRLPYYPTRKLTILALDPSVKDGSKILRTQIEIPNEQLEPGLFFAGVIRSRIAEVREN
jgi:hypothetical protein